MKPTLPVELYKEILCHLTSTSDLYNLLFVSRSLQYEAERLIFRTVSLDPTDMTRFERFKKRVESPRCANLVIRLDISNKDRAYYAWNDECIQALHAALRHLICLKHFSFGGNISFSSEHEDQADIFLLEHATTSLESLAFDRIEPEHVHLLNKQIQLKELFVTSGQYPWTISAFPMLTIVGCQAQLAKEWLNDPTHVPKISRFRLTQGTLPTGSPLFTSVRAMDVCLFTVDVEIFSRIVCKFPNLEYLKCTVQPRAFMVNIFLELGSVED